MTKSTEAPYGYKKDGTPAKKRGRKPKEEHTILTTTKAPIPLQQKEPVVELETTEVLEEETVTSEEKGVIDAPYGFKKDGSPAKKRGRKSKEEIREEFFKTSSYTPVVVDSVAQKADADFVEFRLGNRVFNKSDPYATVGTVKSCKEDCSFVCVSWDDHREYWIPRKCLVLVADRK